METIKCSSCSDYDLCTLLKVDTSNYCRYYRPVCHSNNRTRVVGHIIKVMKRVSKLNELPSAKL